VFLLAYDFLASSATSSYSPLTCSGEQNILHTFDARLAIVGCDIDCSDLSAILWVIQITTSHSHSGDGGGSALGYRNIRAIIAKLKEQLGEQQLREKKTDLGVQSECQGPSVQVRYLLVVPKGGSRNLKWCFPKGWNDENCVGDGRRGDVYCLELPIEVYSITTPYALQSVY